MIQRIMTGAQARAAGVDTDVDDATVVVIGDESGTVKWVSIPPTVDADGAPINVLATLNPSIPAEDHRA